MNKNYLFGPFIGELTYELNYFVGHAIYLRKKNPKNKIIVLTRKEHFDLYGKYATTFLSLPLNAELIPHKFGCKNMKPNLYDEIARKFSLKYKNEIKVHDHIYPHPGTQLEDIRWYYPRHQVDFDFKPRSENRILAEDISHSYENLIFSSFDDKIKKYSGMYIFPAEFLFQLNIEKAKNITALGLVIEMIRLSKYVYADIDDIIGRLAMLLAKPLITKRNFIDAQELNPINPYGSIVIGCQNLSEGIKYLGGMKIE